MASGLIYRHIEPYLTSQVAAATQSIDIVCPFVRSAALERILTAAPSGLSIRLVMRWEPHDFLEGHSDPEVFLVCRKLGIALFRHTTVHMKVWCVDRSRIIPT